CPNCGAKLAPGAGFCKKCGTPVMADTGGEPEPEKVLSPEEYAARRKKITVATLIAAGLLAVFVVVYITVLSPIINYNRAKTAIEEKEYTRAYLILSKLPEDFRDTKVLKVDIKYLSAGELFDNKDYSGAMEAYKELGDYKDSKEKYKSAKFEYGKGLLKDKNYTDAIVTFKELGDFGESKYYLKQARYEKGSALLDERKYLEAKEQLSQINPFRDSAFKLKIIEFSQCSVGSFITFGSCEQDGRSSNGDEGIVWKVVKKDKTNRKVELVSRYGLFTRNYNSSGYSNWSGSSLRSYLNGSFYQNAFDSDEKTLIIKTHVHTGANATNTNQGSDTDDYIFIPSIYEVEHEFMTTPGARRAKGVAAAKKAFVGGNWCDYMLRDVSSYRIYNEYYSNTYSGCATVSWEGNVHAHASVDEPWICPFDSSLYAVRPVMWVQY
ncbi:MAG: zinc-ribbon domain-containing protein, partial [Abditibacteriota bacterium]|nr:zinc-ribbon domain-containing protein [Abditibacteriota bacterium]